MTKAEIRRLIDAAHRMGYERGKEAVEARQRTNCTVCGDPQEWYRLDSSGRCTRCQP